MLCALFLFMNLICTVDSLVLNKFFFPAKKKKKSKLRTSRIEISNFVWYPPYSHWYRNPAKELVLMQLRS